ncbi:pentapeptide repeat-containing protein [Nocardia tengchongensis]|uniref:pentapeptide repeat-containing protein n=1 Tax=Nocardia tengchongensis TaxID=2055889 RepID=UPI00367DF7D2
MALGVQASLSQPVATFLAGAGALTAGVLAYVNGQRSRALTQEHHADDRTRERERHQEDAHRARESDLRDRYTAIATQIAHTSAAIRQAGVYALTALADDWHALGEDDERQVCINLLQWYLRVPAAAVETSEQDLPELEIRQTIAGILTERRRRSPEHPKSWAATAISFRQASLPNCVLRMLDFSRLGLDHANLFGVNLTGAALFGATLTGANLTAVNLTGAHLIGTNLTGANLFGADLTGANLLSANLTGANLTGVDLTGANLLGADLTSAYHNASTQWPDDFIPSIR